MTAKEKARDLVEKMAISTSWGINYTGGEDIPMYQNLYAKQCALIAVDEILKVAFYSTDEIYNFYIEVKQEIERL